MNRRVSMSRQTVKAEQVAKGLVSLLPVLGPSLARSRRGSRDGGRGAGSARYCYSVWLRHLVHAENNGLNTRPEAVLELGPGNSLGVGLAALLSGAARYIALDVIELANVERNLQTFDDLVALFRQRQAIPDSNEFPEVQPLVETHDFPSHILDETRMRDALAPSRLELIRNSVLDATGTAVGGVVTYKTPWSDPGVVKKQTVDLIYSQAVMEHIDDLSNAYRSMSLWLKPGGYVSHAIDFKSHGLAAAWNGHWTYSDFTWKLIRGNRPYGINRAPLSVHADLLKEHGFTIRTQIDQKRESAIRRAELASRFRGMSEDDMTTSSVFIQAAL